MKKIIYGSLFFLSFNSLAQMTGDLPNSGRKMLSSYSFESTGTKEGVVTLDVVVNIDGNVTSTAILPAGTTIVSTPTVLKIENEVRQLKFEKGYQYPKYHHASFTIHVVKPS